MAQIRRSILWAAHPFVVFVSFLFSVIHLGPPAWAKAVGNTEPRQDEVTALIGELCENERFDHRISEELRRLQSGTQDLAQADPETVQDTISPTLLPSAPYRGPAAPEPELAPLNRLAPPPDVLLRQQPGAQMQQQPSSSAQPQQSIDAWQQPQSQPQSRPGATVQPQRALPGLSQSQPALQVQPKQTPGLSQSQPALKAQPKQALLQK